MEKEILYRGFIFKGSEKPEDSVCGIKYILRILRKEKVCSIHFNYISLKSVHMYQLLFRMIYSLNENNYCTDIMPNSQIVVEVLQKFKVIKAV